MEHTPQFTTRITADGVGIEGKVMLPPYPRHGEAIRKARVEMERTQAVLGLVLLAVLFLVGAGLGWCLRGIKEQDRTPIVIEYTQTPSGLVVGTP